MDNILIKGSGDITKKNEFINFIIKKSKKNYVVVICGGGTRISSALQKAGYKIKFDKLNRRITKTHKERLIMKKVLEQEEENLQNKLLRRNITVVSPILYIASILCPINGDDLVKAYELGFNKVYVFTTKKRLKKKKITFQNFPKIKILAI